MSDWHESVACRNADPDPHDWRSRAACADMDVNVFFPERGDDKGEQAKTVCRRCPVTAPCLDYALGFSMLPGVWGGHNEEERKRIRRKRLRERRGVA